MGCAGEGGGGGCVALRLGGSKDFGPLMCVEASGEPFVAIEVSRDWRLPSTLCVALCLLINID